MGTELRVCSKYVFFIIANTGNVKIVKRSTVLPRGTVISLSSGKISICKKSGLIRLPRGYKLFFMLNSAEHEIVIAHKYEIIVKFCTFQAQISLECYLSCS